MIFDIAVASISIIACGIICLCVKRNADKKIGEKAKLEDLREQVDKASFKVELVEREWATKAIQMREEITALKKDYKEQEQLINSKKEAVAILEQSYSNLKEAVSNYADVLDEAYDKKEMDFDAQIKELDELYDKRLKEKESEIQDANNSLSEIRTQITAGVSALANEQREKEQLLYYAISISEDDKNDIFTLQSIRNRFTNPVVINKLIWSEFYQKKAYELIKKVFGETTLCGIYKITNLQTKKIYIGQSKNIQERMKKHMRCGCGIDAPASNKLYKNIQEFGLHNFTFELVEECKEQQLDEREKFWIDIYQSNIYGLNTKGGNKG